MYRNTSGVIIDNTTMETDDSFERATSVTHWLHANFENLVELLVRMFVMPHIRMSGY